MSKKRAFYGDLRLWWAGRGYVESVRRGVRQTHHGIDRKESLPIGANPNFESDVEIVTFFAPTTAFDQAAFRAYVAAMIDALTERAVLAPPSHPLLWIADVTLSKVVGSYSSPTYTVTAHGFSNGDRVLIRKLGAGDYLYGTIANAATDTFEVTTIAQGTAYAPAAGHDVHLVERAWEGQFFDGMAPLPSEGGEGPGDYYAPRASYRFFGTREGVYTRSTVDLDA